MTELSRVHARQIPHTGNSVWHVTRKIVFAVSAALALAYTPLKSSGVPRAVASCELSAPLAFWWSGILNGRHIISYGVLCLLALTCFARHRVLKAIGTTLIISGLVELEQAFLVEGHCRVRDMLPNVLAVCSAMLVWLVWQRARSNAD